jgi:hypothetical protein
MNTISQDHGTLTIDMSSADAQQRISPKAWTKLQATYAGSIADPVYKWTQECTGTSCVSSQYAKSFSSGT